MMRSFLQQFLRLRVMRKRWIFQQTPTLLRLRLKMLFTSCSGNAEKEDFAAVFWIENLVEKSRVYGANFMRDGVERELCRKFEDGRKDAHDDGGAGRKFLACKELLQRLDQLEAREK
ncbi:hypothetical protein AVEN_220826-1 [Araneus ventricosus]|uniref:Uncharacterized protein n=1 Tax=Araneus ventricosus TaxID=182803 RepID=A0A4Y2FSF5_ARAVE|nr:hypothetical protein AVEN_220826-1 [Araneus ventricosus]